MHHHPLSHIGQMGGGDTEMVERERAKRKREAKVRQTNERGTITGIRNTFVFTDLNFFVSLNLSQFCTPRVSLSGGKNPVSYGK